MLPFSLPSASSEPKICLAQPLSTTEPDLLLGSARSRKPFGHLRSKPSRLKSYGPPVPTFAGDVQLFSLTRPQPLPPKCRVFPSRPGRLLSSSKPFPRRLSFFCLGSPGSYVSTTLLPSGVPTPPNNVYLLPPVVFPGTAPSPLESVVGDPRSEDDSSDVSIHSGTAPRLL